MLVQSEDYLFSAAIKNGNVITDLKIQLALFDIFCSNLTTALYKLVHYDT